MKWNYLFIVLAIGVLSSCYEEDTVDSDRRNGRDI